MYLFGLWSTLIGQADFEWFPLGQANERLYTWGSAKGISHCYNSFWRCGGDPTIECAHVALAPQLTEDDNELSSHHPHRPRQTISDGRRQSHVKFYSETAPIEKCDRNRTDLMYDTCLLSHPNLLTTRSKEATAYRCYEDALRYRKGVV